MTIGRIPSVEGGIQPTIVDAKGDLIAATAADTVNRLAVGSNDQVLVADSAASTGLAWKSYGAQFVAGKNKIINGDFGVWQRGTSFTIGANGFTADRWYWDLTTAIPTGTISRQTFTPGTAPVAGYEGSFFLRTNITANNGCPVFVQSQRIEDVRTLAGQTATISFWAKADAATSLNITADQIFGSGGSSTVSTTVGSPSLTTSWQRFSYTISVPSMSGKTIGTNSYLALLFLLPTSGGVIRNGTYDIWGVQVEAGSVATPFTTATGTIQGELAACQRYYWVLQDTQYLSLGLGNYPEATKFRIPVQYPVTMRTAPTLSAPSGSGLYSIIKGAGNDDFNDLAISSASKLNALIGTDANVSGTAGQAFYVLTNTTTGTVIAFSAEL